MQEPGGDPLDRLRKGGKRALARALAALEAAPAEEATLALLDAALAARRGIVLGVTGPPGVGKSTLVSALCRIWRRRGATVAVLAVDPTSTRTGGALLGDRARFDLDPEDPGIFTRSLAAGDRLGGLSELSTAAGLLLSALFDRVIIETVGVGQSETEIRAAADLVLLALQPAAGDLLQFMKAGVLELPDLFVVTKADLGAPAARTRRELEAALASGLVVRRAPVLSVSALGDAGPQEVVAALEDMIRARRRSGALAARREEAARMWLERSIREAYGRFGLQALHRGLIAAGPEDASPFRRFALFARRFEARFQAG